MQNRAHTSLLKQRRAIPRRFVALISFLVFAVLLGVGLFYAIPTRAVPGDFAVYRETTAFETITTTPQKLSFNVTVSEGTPFSIDGSGTNLTLSEAGHYLAMYNLPMETISGTNRSEIQGQLDLDGYDLPYGRSTCYIRRTEGIDECWMAGAAVFESTTTSQVLSVESYKTDSNSASVRRRPNESGLMLVRLDDDWDYARVQELGGGQTFNSTTWTTVSWDTNDELDAGYSRLDGAITLAEAGHYLITSSVMFRNSGGARRNNETRLTLDGYELPGTRVTAYLRTTNDTDDHVATFVGIIEATTTDQVLRLQGVCEGEACGNISAVGGQMGIAIAKLPETAEFIRLGYSADDQLVDVIADPFDWDTEEEVNGASFSHSTVTNPSRINIDQDGDYLFLSSFYTDRTSTTDGNRQQPHWEWRTNGTTVATYGSFAKYNRGDQSTTGTYSAGSAGGMVYVGLTDTDYVEILATDEGTGADPLSFYDSPRLGIQGVRLASLLSPDVSVSALGTQAATSSIPATKEHIGATFYLDPSKGDETITDITITENGTVDAANDLNEIRLYYDLDTTTPHNCAAETYDGTEAQYGATSTFPTTNGSITFSDSLAVGTTSPMCVYVVYDVLESATDGDTVEFEISDPLTDVLLDSGFAGPDGVAVALSGTTTLVDDELTQIHYHWRNDDGNESTASSATGGGEDTSLAQISKGSNARLRIELSNEGSVDSASVQPRIEYALEVTSCDVATGWTDVGAGGRAWDMFDSSNLTEGNNTTNIAESIGGVTDENTTFLTLNAAVRDTTSQVASLAIASDEYLETEYSVQATASATDGASYCFRVTDAGTPFVSYDVYPRATIAADVVVSATSTQVAAVDAGDSDVYIGGGFVIAEQAGGRDVTDITITETGSIDAQNDIDTIRLFYELDTSSPYDCASENYAGSETQYGATSTGGFSSANGSSTFTQTVGITSSATMCVYVLLDVSENANNGDTIDIEIAKPGDEVEKSSALLVPVNPNPGSYFWKNSRS